MKRHPIIAVAALAAVLLCFAAAAPFISVTLYQSSLALRGSSTNLFASNSVLLNAVVDHSSRQPTNPNLTTLAGGNGSPLTTGIPASAISSGTMATGRLPATIVLSDRPQSFSSLQTFSGTMQGSVVTTNPPNHWRHFSERQWGYYTFIGNHFSAAEAPWGFTAIASGSRNLFGGSANYAGNGILGILTSASAASGGFEYLDSNGPHWMFPSLEWAYLITYAYTNSLIARIGEGNSASTSDPVDGSYYSISNNVLAAVTINNSTKAVSATTWIWPAPATKILLTCSRADGNPTNTFSVYTNVVQGGAWNLAWTVDVMGTGTNRTSWFSWGAWCPGTPGVNTPILELDDMWWSQNGAYR